MDEWRGKEMEREKRERDDWACCSVARRVVALPSLPRTESTNRAIPTLLASDQTSNDVPLQSAFDI